MRQLTRISREASSLRQRTTDALRTAILDGVFAPGQKLSERELCEQLDVSRPCIRESLQHLQAEGLVNIVLHRGPEVSTMNKDEVRDLYDVRTSLESLVIRGFVRHATPLQKKAMRSCFDQLAAQVKDGDSSQLLNTKSEFYEILIEGCGNSVVGQLLRQLNNRVTVLRRRSMSRPGRLPKMLKELDALVCALELGHEDQAVALCTVHLQNACAHALDMPTEVQ
ncbi:GntR family transcriptional regulator [Alcaligenes sp. 13f]|uniref:GntR family transcriptional regulator n=1 Tax=Alcaligenes sp. 13f TaxID=2841924 RepID=UPI001CF6BC75|nr:GntR family transcriptional regulator [Alcaligenes sp. 13f]MCB4322011.1 GntR family transcriptional regulator [Alcaligenes sp. 13f]